MKSVDKKLRVFLCHSSQDKPIVRELYQRLLAERWIDPWLDEEKLLPGQDWNLEIEKAAESSDAVIVCISSKSVSKEGYIQKEIRKVLDIASEKPEGTVFFIPLRLDECELPRSMRMYQYLDYFPGSLSQNSLNRLLVTLKLRADTLYGSIDVNIDLKTNVRTPETKLQSQPEHYLSSEGGGGYSILFLAADPTDATRLRLGEELREIQEKLQLSKQRDRFKLEQRMSVRPADISQALLDVQPQIVHFSGHGIASGELCFEDSTGRLLPIRPDALAALFEQFSSQVNCVILNACFSETQAEAIRSHIDYVIGMNKAVGDHAAIAFAIGFYQALGAGRPIDDAYKLGCVQIRLHGIEEHLTPVLLRRDNARGVISNPKIEKTILFHLETEPKLFVDWFYQNFYYKNFPADQTKNMPTKASDYIYKPIGQFNQNDPALFKLITKRDIDGRIYEGTVTVELEPTSSAPTPRISVTLNFDEDDFFLVFYRMLGTIAKVYIESRDLILPYLDRYKAQYEEINQKWHVGKAT